MSWKFVEENFDYRIYSYRLDDAGSYGGSLLLIFELEEGTAFMEMRLDNNEGNAYYDDNIVNHVEPEWALGVAKAVDGWEFPTETPE